MSNILNHFVFNALHFACRRIAMMRPKALTTVSYTERRLVTKIQRETRGVPDYFYRVSSTFHWIDWWDRVWVKDRIERERERERRKCVIVFACVCTDGGVPVHAGMCTFVCVCVCVCVCVVLACCNNKNRNTGVVYIDYQKVLQWKCVHFV